jgi:hypothetical protein
MLRIRLKSRPFPFSTRAISKMSKKSTKATKLTEKMRNYIDTHLKGKFGQEQEER